MDTEGTLRKAVKELERAGIGTARLDALVLLEDVTGRDRGWLLANPRHELSPAEQVRLTELLKRRAEHTPLAYVRGNRVLWARFCDHAGGLGAEA